MLETYQKQLDKATKNYLYSRGLTDETIATYKLGKASNYGTELSNVNRIRTLDRTPNGRGYKPFFVKRVMFPYFDINNNLIGFTGRATEQSQQVKYLKSRGLKQTPYGLFTIDLSPYKGKIVIVEGNIDTQIVFQNTRIASIATSGTSGLTDVVIRDLHSKGIVDTLFIGDNDKAGQEFNLKSFIKATKRGFNVSIGTIPTNFKDIGEMKENFKLKNITIQNGFDWAYSLLENISNPYERKRFFDEFLSDLDHSSVSIKMLKRLKTEEHKHQCLAKYKMLDDIQLGLYDNKTSLKYMSLSTQSVLKKESKYFKFLLEEDITIAVSDKREIGYIVGKEKLTEQEEKEALFLHKVGVGMFY